MGYAPMPPHAPKISETTVELGSNTPINQKNIHDCIVLLDGGSGFKTSYNSARNVDKGTIAEDHRNSSTEESIDHAERSFLKSGKLVYGIKECKETVVCNFCGEY